VFRIIVAFAVANDEHALLLIDKRHEEEQEKFAQQLLVERHFIGGNPTVAHGLQNEADEMHLPVSARSRPRAPAEPVGANDFREQFQIFFRVSAKRGKFAFPYVNVRVQLERLANEHILHHAAQIKATAENAEIVRRARNIVAETARAVAFDAFDEAFDKAPRFVFF